MSRTSAGVALLGLLAAALQPPLAAPLSAQQRSLARVGAELVVTNAVGAVVLAASDHGMDSPAVWAQDASGFNRRLGVRAVQFATSAAAEVGVAAWRGETLVYTPCRCVGAGARLGHAAMQALTVGRADHSRAFAWPIAIGAVIGGAASAPLLPREERVVWTLSRPITTLLMRGVLNAAREFWP